MPGIDPAHRVERICAQGRKAAELGRHEPVEKVALPRVDDAALVGVADDERRLDGVERAAKMLVLDRLGRLIEQEIEADRARRACVDRFEQLAQKVAIDRRAVGEALQRLVGDGDDDDIRILRLGRQQRRRLPIADEAIKIFEKADAIDGKRGEAGADQHGEHGRRHGDEAVPCAAQQVERHAGVTYGPARRPRRCCRPPARREGR